MDNLERHAEALARLPKEIEIRATLAVTGHVNEHLAERATLLDKVFFCWTREGVITRCFCAFDEYKRHNHNMEWFDLCIRLEYEDGSEEYIRTH